MSFNISFIVQAIDQFSPVAQKIASGLDKIKSHAERAATSVKGVGDNLKNAGKAAMLSLTAPIAGVGIMALKSAAKIESMSVSFETLLKSKDKADVLMKDLIKFAELTPFEMEDIGSSVRQLLGANIPLQDIIKTLSMIGDVASGANVPLSDMTHIFTKSINKGKAQAEELNQMAERGIPIMQMLATMFKTTTDAIYSAAETGQISAKVIKAAFVELTKKGGLFYQMAIKQSKTLGGIFSTLKDVVEFTLGAIGMEIVNAFSLKDKMIKFISWLEKLQLKIKEFMQLNPILTKWILIILAAAAVLGPFLFMMGLLVKAVGIAVLGFSVFTKSALLLGKAIKYLGIALRFMFFSPLGLVITAIAALVIGLVYAYHKFEPFRKIVLSITGGLVKFWKAVWGIINPLNILSAFGKILYNHFLPFKLLIDGITWIFKNWPAIIDKATGSFNKLTDKAGNIANIAAGAFDNATNSPSLIGAPSPVGGKNGNATVTININDKNNTVKSVETNNKKGVDLAVGKNMRNV
jgi:tape measure domain-containing protein